MTQVHNRGQLFRGRGYELSTLTEILQLANRENLMWYFPQVQIRMIELGVTPQEIERIIEYGEVVSYEISPWLREMRLEVFYKSGDMVDYRPVFWLDHNYIICLADIKATNS